VVWVRASESSSSGPLSAEPLIIVLIGPGGVGKGTVARRLLQLDHRLWLSRSWTTRAPRPSEKGDEYHFVSREEFNDAIERGQFFEWAEFHGNLYGTPLPTPPADHDVLLEIEVQGAGQVRQRQRDAVIFLLTAPSLEHLEGRLRGRGDHDDHVTSRLLSSRTELALGQELADFVVVNDDVDRVSHEIVSILKGLRQTR
jgi:guanylate kinase